MNKKIESLVEKAYDEVASSTPDIKIPRQFIESLTSSIIEECMNICRREWYDVNNEDTIEFGPRDVAIHVGKKAGINNCMNSLAQLRDKK